jgi:hypothetical protein
MAENRRWTVAEFDQALAQRLAMLEAKQPKWKNGRITSYYPDAPISQWEMEGGPLGRGFPVLTFEKHLADPVGIPFVTVAADITLEGNKLIPGFGPRIHFYAFPKVVFRILDTGGAFKGEGKRYRKEGFEPFDIATDYAGNQRKIVGELKYSTYWIEWGDVLKYPSDLRKRLTDELKRKYRTLSPSLKQKYGLAEAVA